MAKVQYSPVRKAYSVLIAIVGLGILGAGLSQEHLAPTDVLYALILAVLGVVLSAVWPNVRWAIVQKATGWALFRNSGMYALMGIAGATVYKLIADQQPLQGITLRNVAALIAALLVVRLINDLVLIVNNMITSGWREAWRKVRATWRAAWGAEAQACLPALLTALLYSQATIRWPGLVLWLLLLAAGAIALQALVRTRVEVTRRLAELSTANAHMTEHNALEAALAGRLSAASVDLAGYASRLATALLQQHTAVTQITSTVEELAQQARYIADAAGAVDSTSEAALVTAGRGQEAAAGSVQAMGDLELNVREMNTRMTTLESRSRLIHRTLQTINNIAGETHLLALNATIEAAGAGEQGRRFSVVAQQINALADQALRAAGEIQVTVREIEAATADTKGVIERGLAETRRYTGQVDEARRSMEVILGAVGRASEMAQQIRLATQQQTQASSQVTDAMREIAASMGSAAAEGSAMYTAAEHLRHMAADLRGLDTPAVS